MKHLLLSGLLSTVILLAACGQENEPVPVDPASETPAVETPASEPFSEVAETVEQVDTPVEGNAVQAPDQQPAATPLPATASAADPTASPAGPVETAEPAVQRDPIEVTYFTPSQGEGPYYPVNKLDDRDNDLTVLEGVDGTPAGQIVEFDGVVYDAAGMPQPGIVVEIWQTDESGVYLHPNDPGTDQRDPNFQFYGESVTTADGRYDFRTILPGRYEPRPRHIHVKVKLDGQELLTTQFYFANDPELVNESMLAQVGDDGEHLIITLKEAQDEDGDAILAGQRNIILDIVLAS